ncbi:cyclin-D5-1-like [Typha latifolia]|uniref:cyclin-D5-1-like n=1 Tax=Typha latifolia TaxID=4733 RepID=UPI003C2AE852
MEDSDSSISISSLVCHEDCADLDAKDGYNGDRELFLIHKDANFLEIEEEYIEKLVSRESSCSSSTYCDNSSITSEDWFKCSRSDAIQWILKNKIYFRFSCRTAYLAVTYFDRFCLRRSIDKEKLWAFRLLSIACLSLAAKMEECRPPSLSEFQVEEYEFSCNAIQRMELLVLTTLEWRMSSITPFEYLNYFTSKFKCKDGSKDLMHKSLRNIFATSEAINVMDQRPSTVALAAVLAAYNEGLTEELVESKISTLSLCGSLEKEHVYACYNAMNQRLASSDLSADCPSVNDAIEVMDSTSFTANGNKRRRLQLPNFH